MKSILIILAVLLLPIACFGFGVDLSVGYASKTKITTVGEYSVDIKKSTEQLATIVIYHNPKKEADTIEEGMFGFFTGYMTIEDSPLLGVRLVFPNERFGSMICYAGILDKINSPYVRFGWQKSGYFTSLSYASHNDSIENWSFYALEIGYIF